MQQLTSACLILQQLGVVPLIMGEILLISITWSAFQLYREHKYKTFLEFYQHFSHGYTVLKSPYLLKGKLPLHLLFLFF